jgi:hypothetical protein
MGQIPSELKILNPRQLIVVEVENLQGTARSQGSRLKKVNVSKSIHLGFLDSRGHFCQE